MSMTDNTAPVTWLTREAYDRLKDELDYLIGRPAARIAAEISARREEGDLRENGGYHAAREEQGKQEARIRQLQAAAADGRRSARRRGTAGVAGPGMVVTVRFAGDDESETFLIGSREETAADLEVYSAASPLGKALDGAKVGETRTYETPNGKTMSVTLQKAEPFSAVADRRPGRPVHQRDHPVRDRRGQRDHRGGPPDVRVGDDQVDDPLQVGVGAGHDAGRAGRPGR